MSNKNTPQIRFKDFTDAWEQRKFSDIANRKSSLSDLKHLPRLEYEDINAGQGTLNKDLKEKKSSKIGLAFEPGDVLFGKLRPYLKNWFFPDFKGIAVGDWWVLQSDTVDSQFLYYLIQTDSYMYAANLSAGSKMPRSDWNLVSNTVFFVPPSKSEQVRIGTFFHKLDDAITLHQRKCEKLKKIKSAFLSDMFPKNGESVPKRRFKDFTDAWEQRKLGDLGETFSGLAGKSAPDFGHGEARFVTYMNVYKNPVALKDLVEAIEIDKNQNEVKKGDVLFTTSSETPDEVAMSSVWLQNTPNTYLNSFCFGYRPKVEIDSYFLAYLLRADSFRKDAIVLAQGISRYNISKNGVMNISISVPSIAEQARIGAFFRKLDDAITLHQRKCEKLKKIKAAYLKAMFV